MNCKEYPRMGGDGLFRPPGQRSDRVCGREADFQKAYAFFRRRLRRNGYEVPMDGQWHDTPAGVAHFLEHKTFDTKDGNALQDLAANGASPNAFTSSAITGYYFESTEKFYENLKILLSLSPSPTTPRRVWTRSRASSARRSG